jgi:hypothetical protein
LKHFIKLERKTEIYEDRIPQKKECLKNQVSHARQTEIQIERLLKTERKIEFELQGVSGTNGLASALPHRPGQTHFFGLRVQHLGRV